MKSIKQLKTINFTSKSKIATILLITTLFLTVLTLRHFDKNRQAKAATAVIPMTIISRGTPAYASSGNATAANDNNFDTKWRSNGTQAWLAYDLSSKPTSQRQQVLLVWYNETNSYEHTLINEGAYNMPGTYTIDINNASGGGQPPSSGWTTIITTTNNKFHSRQHTLNMSGANWIRINVTGVDGSSGNMDSEINMDIYDATNGTDDNFIIFGDSITAGAMGHNTANGIKSFSDLIQTALPAHFPVQENGGTGYLTSGDGATNITRWLNNFPGKYVGLAFGTNDSWGCSTTAATTVYNNYSSMIKTIVAANKTPIIALMPWSTRSDIQQCAISINEKLKTLPLEYPQAIIGPDLYTATQGHSEYFGDGIHPNNVGNGIFHKTWADAIISKVYNTSTQPSAPTPTPTPTTNPAPTQGSSSFSDIHVSGNKILNAQNQQITLRGVNRSGAEYACQDGYAFMDAYPGESEIQAMAAWKINSVRIPLNEHCWLGLGTPAQYSGTNYQNFIKQYVTLLNKYNIYPMLDLQWHGPGSGNVGNAGSLNKENSVNFWTSAANLFKDNKTVMFDLINEPRGISWSCWKDGTNCTNTGMQEMITAIRAAGAENIIILGGLQYANDLSQWIQYKPNDPLNQLVASTHIYIDGNSCNNTTCYNNTLAPVAQQVPLIAGEFGPAVNGNTFDQNGLTTLLNWLENHQSSYYAWSWNTWGGTNSLITNYGAGTERSPFGTFYKSWLNNHAGTSSPNNTPIPTATNTPATPTSTACNIIPPTGTGKITLPTITTPSTGNYTIYSRVMVPEKGNSFYLQIDNTCPILVSDTLNANNWDWISSGNINLTANTTHTITIYGNSPNVMIDEVILSQSCLPTGTGENCFSNPIPTPTPATAINNPTSTPMPTTASSENLILYDNTINSKLNDGTYSYSSKNSCDTSFYYSAPCSYAIAYQAWGGLNLRTSTGLNTNSYKSLEYKINTHGQAISNFGVLMTDTSGNLLSPEIALSDSYLTNLTNGWVQASIPLSKLNPLNSPVGTIQLKNELNASQSTIHYDDIMLTGGETSTPTATSAPVSTSTPIPTNTPKPTATPTKSPEIGNLTFIKSSTAKGNFGSGINITIPNETQTGDLLIAVAGTNGKRATWTMPAGWQAGKGSATVSTQGLNWFWKVANSSEAGKTVRLKASQYSNGGGLIAVYRGASKTNPIAAVSLLAKNDNNGNGNVTYANVNSVSLSSQFNISSLIFTSWQEDTATITFPTGFINEVNANDGFGFIEIAQSLNGKLTNYLSPQVLKFSNSQAIIITLQIAILLAQ